jgi:hypothetical protein
MGAGVLWIIYGSLQTLGGMVSLGGRVGAPTIIGLSIGVSFLIAGIQAVMGKARGMLGAGISSIIWGVLVLIVMVGASSVIREFRHVAGIFAVVGLVIGGMLITAGILACAANGKYKAWRASKGL